ncbi:MAG: hypothetical protein MEQ74_12080 [Paracoccus sp.]|nr:hypothetical protein [Paracoccus sp. (in: a-proteobacteria)]
MPDLIPIPLRILNETDGAYLVTQRPHGRDGVWLDKAAVQIPDRNEVKPHHIALVPADLARRKNLGDTMAAPRRAPSPWGRAGA